ncbi:type II pantothenate kinase [Mammaliicoccus sp. Dog046]|uniref:type II pantothenate kinase n=1 Tax=Mammaliicoccus sp. Dog046 TaxID=3034233 RepID=UPI002B259C99|nr:type II pantothenate kinase [Mammaliicoccus sp. Dog046]WQK86075.1 type II pantothenate kinase [Mammaliicoccus sp. Dog046]
MKIGIDAGGTLIKVVIENENERTYKKWLSTEIDHVATWLNQLNDVEIFMTGGKAQYLDSLISHEVKRSIEFDATYAGIQLFLEEHDIHLDNYIFSNVGTGTSIHYATKEQQERAGGTGAGGGMIQGLGYLLTQISDYDQLVQTASQGDRDKIDLKVKHIYKGDKTPISGELTASNFGHVLQHMDETFSNEDRLAAVLGIVGETVTTVSIHAAKQFETENVVYIGSSFINNDLLRKIVIDYTVLRGLKPFFIENGEFSGALGSIYR